MPPELTISTEQRPAGRLAALLSRCYGIALVSFKEKLVYRFEFAAAFVTTVLTAALQFYLWTAVAAGAPDLPLSHASLTTYVMLGQVFSFTRVGAVQRRVLYRVSGGIQSGGIATDLVRPVDYQVLQLCDSLGLFLAELLLTSTPAYAIALLLFDLAPPASFEAALGFAASLCCGFLLSFAFNFLLMMASFWTYSVRGVMRGQKAVLDLFGGALIPLALFPDWLRAIALALPFQGLAYTPLSIYIGAIRGNAIWWALLVQLVWALGLLVLTRLVWLHGARRIVIQGG
jgi:ABC-2 type transport system permease protein